MAYLIGVMLLPWLIAEFVQHLRHKPFRHRMKTGAAWGLGTVAFITFTDSTNSGGLASYGVVVAMIQATVIALIIYWVRVLLDKGWSRPKSEPAD